MTRPGIIVCARMGSTRLPGKVLKPFRGTTVLGSCLDRCEATGLSVIVAMPRNDKELDTWVYYNRMRDADSRVGRFMPDQSVDESDVLGRMVAVAEHYQIDPIIRVTSDCPLIEPGIILSVLAAKMNAGTHAASNVWPTRTFAKGLDVEVVDLQVLRMLNEFANDEEREHVMTGIYSRAGTDKDWQVTSVRKISVRNHPSHYPGPEVNLCIDTAEDLERLSNPQSLKGEAQCTS